MEDVQSSADFDTIGGENWAGLDDKSFKIKI
jgi:hypothetical protein